MPVLSNSMTGTMCFRRQIGYSRVNARVDLLVWALSRQAGLSVVSWSSMKCDASQQALHDIKCPERTTRFPASIVGICLHTASDAQLDPQSESLSTALTNLLSSSICCNGWNVGRKRRSAGIQAIASAAALKEEETLIYARCLVSVAWLSLSSMRSPL